MNERNLPVIDTFKRLMHEIAWSYTDGYELIDFEDGTFSLNKLYIGPDYVQYKTDNWFLTEEAYQDFLVFVKLIQKG